MDRVRTLAIFGLILILFSCSKKEKDASTQGKASFADSTVVALVNGEAIHYDDVNRVISQFLNQLGKDVNQFQHLQSDTMLWNDALDWMVSFRLLTQEARRLNIQADSNEVRLALSSIKRRFPTEQQFFDALQKSKLTIDQFQTNLALELTVQKLLEQQIGSQLKDVTDDEALKYYQEHGEELMRPEQIRVHHILFKVSETADPDKVKAVEAKALRVLERIKKGEDFEALARQYSEDPASALRGGNIGFFSRGDMIKNFEDAAFALKVGQVSDLVRTQLGFHIIRLDERKTSQKLPFEEVKLSIKARLQQEKSDALLKQYVEKLKSKAEIKFRGKA